MPIKKNKTGNNVFYWYADIFLLVCQWLYNYKCLYSFQCSSFQNFKVCGSFLHKTVSWQIQKRVPVHCRSSIKIFSSQFWTKSEDCDNPSWIWTCQTCFFKFFSVFTIFLTVCPEEFHKDNVLKHLGLCTKTKQITSLIWRCLNENYVLPVHLSTINDAILNCYLLVQGRICTKGTKNRKDADRIPMSYLPLVISSWYRVTVSYICRLANSMWRYYYSQLLVYIMISMRNIKY